jgi:hypothetical protein
MQLSKASLTALAAASFMISAVQAATITCISGDAGGAYFIPDHKILFSNNGVTYFGESFAESCAGMVGGSADPYSNYGGGGSSVSASFWITGDSCMNIEAGGNHYYCCPGSIGGGNYDVTSCNT